MKRFSFGIGPLLAVALCCSAVAAAEETSSSADASDDNFAEWVDDLDRAIGLPQASDKVRTAEKTRTVGKVRGRKAKHARKVAERRVASNVGSHVESHAEDYGHHFDSVHDSNHPTHYPDHGHWGNASAAHCGSCGSGHGCKTCNVSVGVEATYLRPDFSRDRADFGIFDNDPFFSSTHHDWEMEAAPRVWIASELHCGWGLRGRYWDYDADPDSIFGQSQPGQQPDTFFRERSYQASFEAYAADLELTHRKCWHGLNLHSHLGARHGRIRYRQISTETLIDPNMQAVGFLSGDFDREFDGTGLTFGLDARHQLGCSCFSLFVAARGSVLWGDSDGSAEFSTFFVPTSPNNQAADIETSDEDELWIGEFQIGAEWRKPLGCCGGRVFFARAMFEYQVWELDEQTFTINGITSSLRQDVLSNGAVDLLGFAFAVGLEH